MKIEFDPAKNEKNIRERGLSFERVAEFDFDAVRYREDMRRDYGEIRWQAYGFLDGRLHMVVFVEVPGGIRVISFRKANKREVKRYEEETKP